MSNLNKKNPKASLDFDENAKFSRENDPGDVGQNNVTITPAEHGSPEDSHELIDRNETQQIDSYETEDIKQKHRDYADEIRDSIHRF
jgi:hypothetical protein